MALLEAFGGYGKPVTNITAVVARFEDPRRELPMFFMLVARGSVIQSVVKAVPNARFPRVE
jgi:hypothetical protein